MPELDLFAVRPQAEQPMVICLDCGHLREHSARGLCHYCYNIHYFAETLDQYPLLRTWVSHLWRMESFVELYTASPRPTKKELADRLEVTVRSVERYISAYQAAQQKAPA